MKKDVPAINNVEESSSTGCAEVLERVLSSSMFERSARLRELLRYVVTESLLNGRTNLHEQKIGAAVFGRPEFYDTSQDNIVRVNATELRKRLENYFSTEGAAEEYIFEIPRGTYSPVFSKRKLLKASLPVSDPQPEQVAEGNSIDVLFKEKLNSREVPSIAVRAIFCSPWMVAALTLLVAALLVIGVLSWKIVRTNSQLHAWRNSPALRMLWGNFLDTQKSTDIVLADTSFSVVQDLTHYQSGLSDYLNFRYQQVAELEGEKRGQMGEDHVLRMLFTRNSGSISDFRTAQDILNLEPGSTVFKLRSGREFSGYAMRHDSSILIGSDRSNPWVDLYRDKLEFRFLPSGSEESDIKIAISQPRDGEQAIYSTSAGTTKPDGYCIIAFLPNLSGEGHTLIIAGTDSQSTEAGGEFLTHEGTLEQLLKQLGRSNFPHFQLLLRTTRMADTPVSSSIVALHAMKE